jgi:hypothetical protein
LARAVSHRFDKERYEKLPKKSFNHLGNLRREMHFSVIVRVAGRILLVESHQAVELPNVRPFAALDYDAAKDGDGHCQCVSTFMKYQSRNTVGTSG